MQRWAQNETCQYYFDELHSKYLIDLFMKLDLQLNTKTF